MSEKPAPNPCHACLSNVCVTCPLPTPAQRQAMNRALVAAVKSGEMRLEAAVVRWKGEN